MGIDNVVEELNMISQDLKPYNSPEAQDQRPPIDHEKINVDPYSHHHTETGDFRLPPIHYNPKSGPGSAVMSENKNDASHEILELDISNANN